MKHSFDTKTTGFTSHPAATPQLTNMALPILLILVSFFAPAFSAQGQITQAVRNALKKFSGSRIAANLHGLL